MFMCEQHMGLHSFMFLEAFRDSKQLAVSFELTINSAVNGRNPAPPWKHKTTKKDKPPINPRRISSIHRLARQAGASPIFVAL